MKTFKIPLQRSVCICLILLLFSTAIAVAQQNIVINMATIDGLPITPDNIFNYHVQSSLPVKVKVTGTIRYRGSNMSIVYSFPYSLRQGLNTFYADEVYPQWQFSSSALQELFQTFKILPTGTYEYCVTIQPDYGSHENNGSPFEDCMYKRADEVFLINLIDPEDNAKLKEFNPLLTWIANYSLSSELTYRVRVAEIKKGQNAVTAVARNQPVYDERNLMSNSIVYPVYAKPLEVNIWYAWTVDAYYKNILLGGAETWRFIIKDSIPPVAQANRSYIDIKRETGAARLTAFGTLKLKYVLDDRMTDSLYLELYNYKNQKCTLNNNTLGARYGDNRYDVNLVDNSNLKHQSRYVLKIKTMTKKEYTLPFQFINPEFVR